MLMRLCRRTVDRGSQGLDLHHHPCAAVLDRLDEGGCCGPNCLRLRRAGNREIKTLLSRRRVARRRCTAAQIRRVHVARARRGRIVEPVRRRFMQVQAGEAARRIPVFRVPRACPLAPPAREQADFAESVLRRQDQHVGGARVGHAHVRARPVPSARPRASRAIRYRSMAPSGMSLSRAAGQRDLRQEPLLGGVSADFQQEIRRKADRVEERAAQQPPSSLLLDQRQLDRAQSSPLYCSDRDRDQPNTEIRRQTARRGQTPGQSRAHCASRSASARNASAASRIISAGRRSAPGSSSARGSGLHYCRWLQPLFIRWDERSRAPQLGDWQRA